MICFKIRFLILINDFEFMLKMVEFQLSLFLDIKKRKLKRKKRPYIIPKFPNIQIPIEFDCFPLFSCFLTIAFDRYKKKNKWISVRSHTSASDYGIHSCRLFIEFLFLRSSDLFDETIQAVFHFPMLLLVYVICMSYMYVCPI